MLKTFIKLTEFLDNHGMIFLPESFQWAKEIVLPNLNLDLPSVERKATIDMILDKKNPIYVQLSDGTQLFFSFEEYKKVKPVVGKTMVLTLQRSPNDKSNNPSKITSCKVI